MNDGRQLNAIQQYHLIIQLKEIIDRPLKTIIEFGTQKPIGYYLQFR